MDGIQHKLQTICLVLIVVLLSIFAWENRQSFISYGPAAVKVNNLTGKGCKVTLAGTNPMNLECIKFVDTTPTPTPAPNWLKERLGK